MVMTGCVSMHLAKELWEVNQAPASLIGTAIFNGRKHNSAWLGQKQHARIFLQRLWSRKFLLTRAKFLHECLKQLSRELLW